MRDYADKHYLNPESLEYKRQRAHAMLDFLGINRNRTDCNHVYRNSHGQVIQLKKVRP